jgi:predicted ArsR family transcriptional regulator
MVDSEEPNDLPSELTRLLRNVPGVHTVYATRSPIPTIVSAVVELVKNEPIGVHLVTVDEDDDHVDIRACIGVTSDESAPEVCRRAHDAIADFLSTDGDDRSRAISVSVGRVG